MSCLSFGLRKPSMISDHFEKEDIIRMVDFEDFLGQGSMETHQIYNAEIIHKEGDFVRVKMWTDYFGNRLEKTFTLYGNSPLLEVRFALTFKNPEANVLGPQPILELGKKHWTEDVFTIPELDGLHEYRMTPEKYYGRLFFLKEGWKWIRYEGGHYLCRGFPSGPTFISAYVDESS